MTFSILSLNHIFVIKKGQTLGAWTQVAKEADPCTRFYSAYMMKECPPNTILIMGVLQSPSLGNLPCNMTISFCWVRRVHASVTGHSSPGIW